MNQEFAMSTATQLMTAAELIKLPRGRCRYELVISPGDSPKRVEKKAQRWLTAGTLAVWTIDPKTRTVKVYEPGGAVKILGAADELTGGTVVQGFNLPVPDTFI
jgi:Uma2 family endonuclease